MIMEGDRREVVRTFNTDGILFHTGTQLTVLINAGDRDSYGCEFEKYHEDMHSLQSRGSANTAIGYGFWISKRKIEECTVCITNRVPDWEV